MKNFVKLIGIIAFVAIIGFSMGCKTEEDDNGGNGGGDQHWAKFKNTTWVGRSIEIYPSTTANLRLVFAETVYSPPQKFLNFWIGSNSQRGYYIITNLDANTIQGNRDGEISNYVLSNGGNTLTLSNVPLQNGTDFNGEYTKVP